MATFRGFFSRKKDKPKEGEASEAEDEFQKRIRELI